MSTFLCADQLRGQTNIVDPEGDLKLGELVMLTDQKDGQLPGHKTRYTGVNTLARVVKNAGSALTPGHAASYASNTCDTTVNGNPADDGNIDGIVDPDITGTVATGDTFLLLIGGPATVIASGNIAGPYIVSAGSGKVKTAAIGTAGRSGRVMEDASSKTDGQTFRARLMCEAN
jgi:hypothetical protein